MKFKTAKAAICNDLLNGGRLSILSCFKKYGVSNLPREATRLIEKPFGIKLKREQKNGKTMFGRTASYFEYSLQIYSKLNKEGIKAMRKYVNDNQYGK